MKRRILCACMIIILVFSFTLPAYAANTTEYSLDDVGMKVSLPSDYIAFTRDINENDPNLSAYGYTKEDLYSTMTSKNMYLDAWDENVKFELIITVNDSTFEDFNQYSDTELSTMATSISSTFEAAGYTYLKSDVYQNNQTKFVKIYVNQPYNGTTLYCLQYNTVYNGKAISITFSSNLNPISSSDEALSKSIIDSIVFNTAPQTTMLAGKFTYADKETQTTFIVPEKWEGPPSSESYDSLGATFISTEDPYMSITYSRYDAWGMMTAEEQAGSTRSDTNLDEYTKDEIAEVYGVSPDEIETVTYGGTEYYKAIFKKTDTTYGTNKTVSITQIFTIDNGYAYCFMFAGTSDSEYYDDFEALLSSVKYNNQEAVSSSAEPSAETQIGNTETEDKYSAGDILLGLIITIVIYSLPIIIYRYAVRKEPVERKKAKKITIIYGIAAFIVMLALIYATGGNGTPGGAIFLWSYVNYKMLIGGKKKPAICAEAPQAPVLVDAVVCSTDNQGATGAEAEQDAEASAPDDSGSHIIRYCRKCGTKLEPGSEFCSQCGEKQ